MYDNTCKFLAENFPTDFASWLLGKPIPLTKLEPSELSAEPIRADSVIFLESSEIILHLEFQTKPDKTIAYRMANYWLRLYGKYPRKEIHQTVIYLTKTKSPLVYKTSFNSKQLNHEFNVVRLWEEPPETFQQHLGLLPLSVLGKTSDRSQTLQIVAKLIDDIEDEKVKSSITAATAIISGLALSKEVIQRLLRSEIMKESVIYQEILMQGEARGEARGEAKGLVKGEARAANQITLNMLRSNLDLDLIAQLTGLTLEQVQKLSIKKSKVKKSPQINK